MRFDSEIFSRKLKVFRNIWSENHFLTYDKDSRQFMEHIGKKVRIWYWQTSDEFNQAVIDLNAGDWRYVEQ